MLFGYRHKICWSHRLHLGYQTRFILAYRVYNFDSCQLLKVLINMRSNSGDVKRYYLTAVSIHTPTVTEFHNYNQTQCPAVNPTWTPCLELQFRPNFSSHGSTFLLSTV